MSYLLIIWILINTYPCFGQACLLAQSITHRKTFETGSDTSPSSFYSEKLRHPSTSPFLTIKVDLQPLFLIKSSFSLKKWKRSSFLCFSAYVNLYLYLCSTQTSRKRQNHIENSNHIHGIHRKGCNGSVFQRCLPWLLGIGVAFPFNPSMGSKKHSERGMVIGLKLLLISEQVCNLISNKIICFPEI